MLKQGSKGEDVKRWQEFLRKAGFDIVADGIFGKATDKATRAFQAQNGLREDGIVGNNTLMAAEIETPSETQGSPNARQLSEEGIAFIKSHEGAVYRVYLDPIGLPTAGVGHLLTAEERKTFKVGQKITREQSDAWLRKDIRIAEDTVNKLVKVAITQNQFDALVSLTFNIGTGAFGGSTVLRKLNAGDKAGAADAFESWVKGTLNGKKVTLAGLVRRRADEKRLFLKD